ncbi:MAG: hypothetical protein ACMUEM_02990 [Flavobacteriales bacterium AspAUS03]
MPRLTGSLRSSKAITYPQPILGRCTASKKHNTRALLVVFKKLIYSSVHSMVS